MKYKYSDVKRKLKRLVNEIMAEYDNSPEYKVRVNLMPKAHNAMSEWEKVDNWGSLSKEQIQEAKNRGIIHPVGDEFKAYIEEIGLNIEDFEDSIKVIHNKHNAHNDPTTIAIHEMTPGTERFKPDGIKTRGSEIATKPKHRDIKEIREIAYKDIEGKFKESNVSQEEFEKAFNERVSELFRANREVDHNVIKLRNIKNIYKQNNKFSLVILKK